MKENIFDFDMEKEKAKFIGIKKYKELFDAFIELNKVAAIHGIIINDVSIMQFWLSDNETPPEKLLGINITHP